MLSPVMILYNVFLRWYLLLVGMTGRGHATYFCSPGDDDVVIVVGRIIVVDARVHALHNHYID